MIINSDFSWSPAAWNKRRVGKGTGCPWRSKRKEWKIELKLCRNQPQFPEKQHIWNMTVGWISFFFKGTVLCITFTWMPLMWLESLCLWGMFKSRLLLSLGRVSAFWPDLCESSCTSMHVTSHYCFTSDQIVCSYWNTPSTGEVGNFRHVYSGLGAGRCIMGMSSAILHLYFLTCTRSVRVQYWTLLSVMTCTVLSNFDKIKDCLLYRHCFSFKNILKQL